MKTIWYNIWLVVSTHLKNISQNGFFPQVGMNIKNIWNHHPEYVHQCCMPFTNSCIKTLLQHAYASRRRCRLGPPITLAPAKRRRKRFDHPLIPKLQYICYIRMIYTHFLIYIPPPFSLNHIIFLSSQQETNFSCENKYPVLVNFIQLRVVFSSNHVPIFQNFLVSRTMPGLSSHTATGKFTAQVIHCDLWGFQHTTRVIQLETATSGCNPICCNIRGYKIPVVISLLVASIFCDWAVESEKEDMEEQITILSQEKSIEKSHHWSVVADPSKGLLRV